MIFIIEVKREHCLYKFTYLYYLKFHRSKNTHRINIDDLKHHEYINQQRIHEVSVFLCQIILCELNSLNIYQNVVRILVDFIQIYK